MIALAEVMGMHWSRVITFFCFYQQKIRLWNAEPQVPMQVVPGGEVGEGVADDCSG